MQTKAKKWKNTVWMFIWDPWVKNLRIKSIIKVEKWRIDEWKMMIKNSAHFDLMKSYKNWSFLTFVLLLLNSFVILFAVEIYWFHHNFKTINGLSIIKGKLLHKAAHNSKRRGCSRWRTLLSILGRFLDHLSSVSILLSPCSSAFVLHQDKILGNIIHIRVD